MKVWWYVIVHHLEISPKARRSKVISVQILTLYSLQIAADTRATSGPIVADKVGIHNLIQNFSASKP